MACCGTYCIQSVTFTSTCITTCGCFHSTRLRVPLNVTRLIGATPTGLRIREKGQRDDAGVWRYVTVEVGGGTTQRRARHQRERGAVAGPRARRQHSRISAFERRRPSGTQGHHHDGGSAGDDGRFRKRRSAFGGACFESDCHNSKTARLRASRCQTSSSAHRSREMIRSMPRPRCRVAHRQWEEYPEQDSGSMSPDYRPAPAARHG